MNDAEREDEHVPKPSKSIGNKQQTKQNDKRMNKKIKEKKSIPNKIFHRYHSASG